MRIQLQWTLATVHSLELIQLGMEVGAMVLSPSEVLGL